MTSAQELEEARNKLTEADRGSDLDDKKEKTEESPRLQSPLTVAEVMRKNASESSQPERLRITPPHSEVGALTEQEKEKDQEEMITEKKEGHAKKEELETLHKIFQEFMQHEEANEKLTTEEFEENIDEMKNNVNEEKEERVNMTKELTENCN